MLAALIEAALRSLILALVVWAGLSIFRIQNVVSQRCAWTAVLIGSLLMPFVLPFTARWHVLPLAMIPASASLDHLQSALAPAASTAASSDPATVPAPQSGRRTPPTAMPAINRYFINAPSSHFVQPPALSTASQVGGHFSVAGSAALLTYFLIAAALLARLFFGFASALCLWNSSSPVPLGSTQIGADFNLRFSGRVSTPVTIGSGIVLPAGYTSWTEEKLRIVLAHERSHVRQRDFHVQILASLYAALSWFSPLGWWLKYKLSDLGESIGDCSGLDAASNRSAYAEILLEFAAMPRPTLIGVAMARPSSISRRIERLLNDSYLRHAISGGASARVAVLVIPTVLFAAGALVRVQAATQSDPVMPTANAATAVPVGVRADPGLPTTPGVPSTSVAPAMIAASPKSAKSPAASPANAAVLSIPAVPPAPSAVLDDSSTQSGATFDRNLTFNGKLDLSVGTASGNITLTRGSANQIHIHGVVKANENGDPARVQEIAANPPIEQEGITIRIGEHGEKLHNISISYQIEAPADTTLNAATASGDITDTGVGEGAKLITASGNITATGLDGGFKIQTGSGNIAIDNPGQGDANAQTGSGDIELKGVNGALQAQTGSGTIKAAGTPSSPWKLQAGSGNIELATGSAPMDLDASTASGSISTISATAMQSSADHHHHLHTQLNGGGPEVRIETGSGDIRVD
ncbi:MAG TPA: M56 family metallopeptidase [Silvibacterium sp.]|nr:M56 family metallopeptidase [Silvibacterium sp.]